MDVFKTRENISQILSEFCASEQDENLSTAQDNVSQAPVVSLSNDVGWPLLKHG